MILQQRKQPFLVQLQICTQETVILIFSAQRKLRVTWEEAQDLLHPPPCVMPSVETIEDKEFEEFEVSVTMS